MKALFLYSNEELRDSITFWLESQNNMDIYGAKDVDEIIENFMDTSKEFSLIICECLPQTEKFIDFIIRLQAKIPIILINDSSNPLDNEKMNQINIFQKITKENLKDNLILSIEKFCAQQQQMEDFQSKEVLSQDENLFCRINTNLLFKIQSPPVDIFIRLSKDKFLKIYHKKETFNEQDKESILNKKKLKYLFLIKEESYLFFKHLEKQFFDLPPKIKQPPESVPDYSDASKDLHETIQNFITKFGLTPDVQSIILKDVKNTLKTMGTKPNLASLLSKIDSNKDRYISSHSINLSYITCAMANAMKWNSDTTFQKLSLASYLHDITLENDKLARIQTIDELEKRYNEFTDEEYKAFTLHPQLSSELLKDFKEIPPDVDIIILQHHESAQGTGFPKGMKANRIVPLAALFIVAHDFVDFLEDHKESPNIQDFITQRRDLYTTGNFKKAFAAIESIS